MEEQYKDVTEKYRVLYSALETERTAFELSQKEELQKLHDDLLMERDKAMKIRDERKASIDKGYNEWLTQSDERLVALQNERTRADKRLSELQYWHPLKQETDVCKEDIRQLAAAENRLQGELAIVRKEMEMMRQEGLVKCGRIEDSYNQKEKELLKELETLNASLAEIEDVLSRWRGSFYEWFSLVKPLKE